MQTFQLAIRIVLGFASLLLTIVALTTGSELVIVALLLSGILLAISFFPWDTWLARMNRDLDNMAKATSSAANAVQKRFSSDPQGGQIIGRDKMTAYSVADELLKWKKLRDNNVVTEDEFELAKTRILQRK